MKSKVLSLIFNYLSYSLYAIGFILGFVSSYQLLLDVYPGFGIFIFLAWFFFTLELFYIIPLYPAFMLNDWSLAYIIYPAFLLGIIFSNYQRRFN
jgi:hypothetical protein|tara:strand:+ start:174 stop:458 length:285 start_codon:yes stop_codon:yes gene_type:complete